MLGSQFIASLFMRLDLSGNLEAVILSHETQFCLAQMGNVNITRKLSLVFFLSIFIDMLKKGSFLRCLFSGWTSSF